MKTKILLLVVLLFAFNTQAQESYKGNILISAYCGLPNTLRLNLSATENIPSDAKYSGLSPFGIRGVMKVNDNVSIGFDVIYGFAKAQYSITDSSFTNGQWTSSTNDYSITKKRLRPQFRINRHFNTGTNLDHYVGFAVGGNSRWTKEYVNKVLVTKNTKENTIGFSMRLCYGFSYTLTHNISLGGEIGIGGPLLQMAVTYKL